MMALLELHLPDLHETDPAAHAASLSAEDIVVDPAFAALSVPLSRDELAQLEDSLLKHGCRDALLIWKGTHILVDGHNRLALCRRHDLPFKVVYLDFADRQAVEAYIDQLQLGRRNSSAEAASYTRGKIYHREKGAHGGDHRGTDFQAAAPVNGARCHVDTLKTAQRLARRFDVSTITIYRDAKFFLAVRAIAVNCGDPARLAILARDTGLPRATVIRLARMNVPDMQRLMLPYLETGKLPRTSAKPATITLPAELKAMAAKLFAKIGPKAAAHLRDLLDTHISAALESTNNPNGETP